MRRERQSITRIFIPATFTGAWRTLGGLPDTHTLFMGRWHLLPQACFTRAIRMLRKAGADEPAKYNYKFKHMTTVGEPIEPEVWRWYFEVVGKANAAIV